MNNVSEEQPSGDLQETGALIRTFLIADIRGYSRFTNERGDEAAARLAGAFADLVRTAVEERGGRLLELRGDEAMAVFDSARQAIRSAVNLQSRFAAHSEEHTDLLLPVGIGLDAGEAVPVEGGYRGGALNLAARLCGIAGPGEVLASEVVTHLARAIEDIVYVDRGGVELKGMTTPVRVVAIASSVESTHLAQRDPPGGSSLSSQRAVPTSFIPSAPPMTNWQPTPPERPAQPKPPVPAASELRDLAAALHDLPGLNDLGEHINAFVQDRVSEKIQSLGVRDPAPPVYGGQSGAKGRARHHSSRAVPATWLMTVIAVALVVVVILAIVLLR